MPKRVSDKVEGVRVERLEDSVVSRIGQRPVMVPYVVNEYHFEGEYMAGDDTRGGVAGIVREGVRLRSCIPYRAWRNGSARAQTRTVGAFPPGDRRFPTDRVTIFVAADDFSGAPGAAQNPTIVGERGDSVAKSVAPGEAVFVHFQGDDPSQMTAADISEER